MTINSNKRYDTSNHKLRNLWDDIKKLIALENELERKISELETEAKAIWKVVGGTHSG